MSNKALWFIAGTAAGVYASVKAKRAAYRLSMPGLIDQASALGVGVRAFKAEMQDGMYEKEFEIRQALVAETQDWELPGNSNHEQLTEKDSH